MEIKIDLNNILFDEDFGPETLQESVRRQVIANITGTVLKETLNGVRAEIARQMQNCVTEAINARLPELFDDILNTEYVPVDQYGSTKPPTTFRKELVKTIQSEMVYKKARYAEPNAFTKAVDSIVTEQTAIIKKDITEQVNLDLAKEAFNAAVMMLREKLGLKA